MEDGTPYIAMELFDGEDLAGLLERERRLSLLRASEILGQAAKALRAAHEARIVHRDIKPSNLFLARESGEIVVKVLDFGIAKETGPATAGQQGATTTGVVLGSPLYMSPEQARGTAIDERSDLWSLGVVLFEMITGEQPFLGASVGDVIAKICGDELPVPSRFNADLSPEIDAFFARVLARDPAARFPSARALSDAFATIAAAPRETRGAAPAGRLDATQPVAPIAPVAAAAPVALESVSDTMAAPVIAASTTLAIEPATRAITVDPAAPTGQGRRVIFVAIATIGAALIGAYALRGGLAPSKGDAPTEARIAALVVITTATAIATPTLAATPVTAAPPPPTTAGASVVAPAKSATARATASARAIPAAGKPTAAPTVAIDPVFGLPYPK